MNKEGRWSDATHLVKKRHRSSDGTRSVLSPIYLSTSYSRDREYSLPQWSEEVDLDGVNDGEANEIVRSLCYSRADNPTMREPELLLSKLEEGKDAAVFSSGMAAIMCVFDALVNAGDVVLVPESGYFACRARIHSWCDRRNVHVVQYAPDFASSNAALSRNEKKKQKRVEQFLKHMTAKPPRLLWIEHPSNPTWDVMDIKNVAECAKKFGTVVVVDSTALSPIVCKPLVLGADIVMHSATKYLNGHGDVLAGALVTKEKDENWIKILKERQHGGAVLGAFDAYLLARGMRTLHLRVIRQCDTALWLAKKLCEPEIWKADKDLANRRDEFERLVRVHKFSLSVLYPGLASHAGYQTMIQTCVSGLFGGMLSVICSIGDDETYDVKKFCQIVAARCELWTPATSLGGFESLIEHRYTVECGGPEGLLRLSCGLEDPRELLYGLQVGILAALTAVEMDRCL